MSTVIKEHYREDQPLEERLNKVKEMVQELRTKIVDLEARVVPTPHQKK